MKELSIDPEFAGLIPTLSKDEFAQLEANILAEGCREALVVWAEEQTLLDGHNRYGICISHEVDFSVAEKSFTDRDAAKRWMLENQLGRRNLTPESVAYLRGKLYREERKAIGAPEGNANAAKQSGQNVQIESTAERIAAKHGVDEKTIRRDAKFSEQLDELAENLGEDFRKEVLSRESRVSRKDVAEMATLDAEALRDVASAVLSGKTGREALGANRRAERVERLLEISAGNTDLQTVRSYPVIYADPPWQYEHVKTSDRSLDNQYPQMSLEAICDMKVEDIATPDAVLFLWATSPKLAEAMRVVEAWGFTYRTCMVWVKDKIGMGYYARQKHELLLICTRGEPPVPIETARPASVIEAPRGKHSAKPIEFYEAIEKMYPELPKMELFCRSPRHGWEVFGNQAKEAS